MLLTGVFPLSIHISLGPLINLFVCRSSYGYDVNSKEFKDWQDSQQQQYAQYYASYAAAAQQPTETPPPPPS
jgi:hypothetical protein